MENYLPNYRLSKLKGLPKTFKFSVPSRAQNTLLNITTKFELY